MSIKISEYDAVIDRNRADLKVCSQKLTRAKTKYNQELKATLEKGEFDGSSASLMADLENEKLKNQYLVHALNMMANEIPETQQLIESLVSEFDIKGYHVNSRPQSVYSGL